MVDIQIGGISFSENWSKVDTQQAASTKISTALEDSFFLQDIAQSRCYTVSLSGFTSMSIPSSNMTKFLPVKNISLTFTSYDNLSIPFMIFGDLPLLNRKKISTIQLTCYDKDNDEIERAVQAWEASCFPSNKYVAYMSEITKTFNYRSFNVKGELNYERTLSVIPAGSVSVSRAYDENGAKLVTFGLVVVGDVGSSANGSSNVWKEIGAGTGNEIGNYERVITGVIPKQKIN